jgi:hypothetical protein
MVARRCGQRALSGHTAHRVGSPTGSVTSWTGTAHKESTMFGWIKTLTTAGNKLARTLNELSATVAEVNSGLRLATGLDKPERKPRVIEHKVAGNGKDGGA